MQIPSWLSVCVQRVNQGVALCRDAMGISAAAPAAAPFLPRFSMRAAAAEAADGAWRVAWTRAQEAAQAFRQLGDVPGEVLSGCASPFQI